MPDISLHSRTTRFAKFLRGAVSIKTHPILEVQKYPTVEWFARIPNDLAEIRSPLFNPNWPSDDVRWLVVARVQEPGRPAAPASCGPWLIGLDLDDVSAAPALNDRYEDKDEWAQPIQRPPTPEVNLAWDKYVTNSWKPWAVKAAIARRVKPIYRTLFAIHQQLQGNADAFDFFIGIGLLDSKIDPAQRLRRHLFAFNAEVLLDDRTGTITVGPAPDFVRLRVETDFLPPKDRAVIEPQIERIMPSADALGPNLQDRVAAGDLLKSLAMSLSAVGAYSDEVSPADVPPNGLSVSYAPALILRPRSSRSLDELLARIEKDASSTPPKVEGGDIPLGWRKMMEESGAWNGNPADSAAGPRSSPTALDRVFFPLPANDEQLRIVRFSNGSPGVVVQGPPGTGKSHTIANLIAHYLASGQRVLVTAQTAQALQVLRDKLPPDLQQLCVSLLGDSRASDKELQRSVGSILERYQTFDEQKSRRKIEGHEKELIASETRLNELERTLHHARAGETEVIEPVQGYRGTRAQIARKLRADKERFSWITDPIPHDTRCPTYEPGWPALGKYHASLDAETRDKLSREVVELPHSDDEITLVIVKVVSAKAAVPKDEPENSARIPHFADVGALIAAQTWLKGLEQIESTVGSEDSTWISELRRVLLRSSLVDWQTRRDEASGTLAKLPDDVIRHIVKVDVVGRTMAEARRDLGRLEAHYKAGGKKRVALFFKPKVIKETEWLEHSVTVEDLPLRTSDDVRRARNALAGWAALDAGRQVWSEWPVANTGSPRTQVALLRRRASVLDKLLAAAASGASSRDGVRQWLAQSLGDNCPTADLLFLVDRRLKELALADARVARDALCDRLRQVIGSRNAVPALHALIKGLEDEDLDAVTMSLTDLTRDTKDRKTHRYYVEFLEQIRDIAPGLADRITNDEGTPIWSAWFIEFEAGWTHARARRWLELVLSKERIEATHRAAHDERENSQEILGKLTAERAWCEALLRINDFRRASLVAWAKAVANIPATGLSVFRKRAAAQKLLSHCLDTIPAWVVSLGRLYEMVEAAPGLFDVAIVDEASQCWLDSLVLFYLAKQVIVVGDDKQISPTIVGVQDGAVDNLATAFLADFHFRSTFTIDSSLFDHAQRYFSASVPLREHFRCVPEIIRFSNEQWYVANPLIPLRQVGKDRLEPLKRTYLPNGTRTGDINEVEANEVVETIARCHSDPAYDDAEFGVICLQGDAQAYRIEHLLLERLGPTVFSERRLRCGNPYAFQGDERDVMFLSMVAAPNVQQQALTTKMFQQRFNVAMSRARDQAWLFHSIQEDELSPLCLRRKVLEFYKRPTDQTINGATLEIPALMIAAERSDRMIERPPKPFESWFELDVALALVARGYTVSAQVEIAHKRIDLVVEGDNGSRLAVECDGEAWHGAEEYEADIARQRQLERAGWTFVRVREGLFYSDEDRAIGEVVAACAELEIQTGGGRARPDDSARAHDEGPTVRESETIDTDSDAVADDEEAYSDWVGSDDEGVDDAESFELVSENVTPRNGDSRTGPFTGYATKDYPDPRTAPIERVREAVLDILTQDGPLPKDAVFRLYRDGCPRVQRAGTHLKRGINRALYALERAKLIVSYDEGKRRFARDVIVHLPSQKPGATAIVRRATNRGRAARGARHTPETISQRGSRCESRRTCHSLPQCAYPIRPAAPDRRGSRPVATRRSARAFGLVIRLGRGNGCCARELVRTGLRARHSRLPDRYLLRGCEGSYRKFCR